MAKHSPIPNTHIYRYKETLYRLHWDSTGMAVTPTEVDFCWVDTKGGVREIKKRRHNKHSFGRFVQNTRRFLSLSDK